VYFKPPVNILISRYKEVKYFYDSGTNYIVIYSCVSIVYYVRRLTSLFIYKLQNDKTYRLTHEKVELSIRMYGMFHSLYGKKFILECGADLEFFHKIVHIHNGEIFGTIRLPKGNKCRYSFLQLKPVIYMGQAILICYFKQKGKLMNSVTLYNYTVKPGSSALSSGYKFLSTPNKNWFPFFTTESDVMLVATSGGKIVFKFHRRSEYYLRRTEEFHRPIGTTMISKILFNPRLGQFHVAFLNHHRDFVCVKMYRLRCMPKGSPTHSTLIEEAPLQLNVRQFQLKLPLRFGTDTNGTFLIVVPSYPGQSLEHPRYVKLFKPVT
jgi:hypothetical protein